MSPTARRVLAQILLVATCVFLAAATLALYATRVLLDSDRFATRAAAALQDPAVRQGIGDRVTDELVLPRQADLLAARPLVASAVAGVVGGDAFASLFRRGVRDVHRAVIRGDRDTLTLTLADVGIVVAAALRELDPALAERIEADERVTLLSARLGAPGGDLARLAGRSRALAYVLGILAVLAAIGAVVAALDRRAAVTRLGVAAVVAGIVVLGVELLARAIVLQRAQDRAVAGAVWDAFMADLRVTALLLASAGAVLAAAAAALFRPLELERPLGFAWHLASSEPKRPVLRVARGLALAAAGVLVIAQPQVVLRLAATVAGLYVLYKGLEALLGVLGGRLEPRPRASRRRPSWRRLGRIAAAGVAVVLTCAALAAGFVASGAADEPDAEITRCNGSAALCDRPLDTVALPATHNSMSVPLPGWFAALQERPIAGQLEDGIRGLLFDTHYADKLPNGRTRTYFASPEDFRRAIQQDGVSAEGVLAAERLRGRLGFRGTGRRGMYLCHTFCELGSTPLADVLDDMHAFLATHPADVVVVINQDYVTPPDFVAAVEDAGLADYALVPPRGARWPTLRELIESDRRLVLLAENHAGAAPWYQLAYERLTQETPFAFADAAQLVAPAALPASCRPNRGPADAPLFLMNHWINTDPVPRPANAAAVNAFAPLLRRARECQRIRGRRVNLLAVDFYKRGDLFGVVDELNGS